MDMLISFIGYTGAVLVLVAYVLVSHGIWQARSLGFQLSNIVGSGLLMTYAALIHAWPNVILNSTWLIIGLSALYSLYKARKKKSYDG